MKPALSRALGTAMQREPLLSKTPRWKLSFTRRVAEADELADLTESDRALIEQALAEDGPADPDAPGVDTVTAAGFGPGATSLIEGTAMPRKWVSDPYLAPFDEASGDGRIIKAGALHARELPLPLLFQESSGFAHEGSVVVGKIGEASFADGGITAAGEYLDDASVAEAVGKAVTLAESGLGHVSVDLGAVTAELVDEAGNPVDWDDLFDAWEDGQDIVVLEQVVDGELIAVTQVATPAFATAKIRLTAAALIDTAGTDIGIGDTVDVETEDAGTVRGRVTGVDEASATVSVQPIDEAGADAGDVLAVAPGAVTVVIDVDEPTEPAPATAGLVFAVDSAGTEVAVGDAVLTDLRDAAGEITEAGVAGTVTAVVEADGDTPAMVTVERSDGAGSVSVPAAQVTVTAKAPAEPVAAEPVAAALAEKVPALVAGAGPLRPAREWFDRQPLAGPTAMTITDDGQIFGHVAQWGQCHVGFTTTCWTPPKSPTDYAHFHVGEVVCADGTHVAVGNMTLGPRHADTRLGYRAAIEHYDSAAAGVGVVRCYEDEFGIQFAGALTPGVTEEQLYDMRRCPVSGDWRGIGGQLDLIGVLSVNSGGYPTPRFATDDAGRTALVAAPGVPVPALEAARGRRRGGMSQRQVMDRLKAELRTELAAEQGRRRRLASVAAAIRRDPRSRLAAAAARVDQ
jgi:hypothetical protein